MNLKEIEQAISLYHQNYSLRDISKILKYHHKTISKHLKKNNVQITNPGNSIKKQYQTPTLPTKEIIKEYNNGKSTTELSKIWNTSDHVISNILKSHIRTPGQTMAVIKGQTAKNIIKLYNDGLSTYEISDLIDINPETIRKFLKKKNLIRSRKEVRKLVSQKLSNENKIYQSKAQKFLETLLQQLNIPYQSEFAIGPWNYDFLIGDRTLLELQSYWHKLPQRTQRDKKKYTFAKENGYKLTYLWEHQLKNETFVRDKLLYHYQPCIAQYSFSELKILEDDGSIAQELMKHHYYGKIGRYGTQYVVFLREKPIASCVFSHIIRKEVAQNQNVLPNEIMELSRFTIVPDYQKRNLASWTISRCIKKLKEKYPHLQKLISYSDLTYGHEGIIYKAAGWKFDGNLPSDYWYITPNRSIKHKKTVWNAAKKAGLKEHEYASKFSLQKVYGMSKHRYIKNI